MKVRLFVTVSAVLLCSWLAATYVRVVPMETYTGVPVDPGSAPSPDEAVVASAAVLASAGE